MKEQFDIFNLQFPVIKNISPRLMSNEIKGMSAEETRVAMKKMFDNFEKQTGYKPILVGDKLPTSTLFPKETIKPI